MTIGKTGKIVGGTQGSIKSSVQSGTTDEVQMRDNRKAIKMLRKKALSQILSQDKLGSEPSSEETPLKDCKDSHSQFETECRATLSKELSETLLQFTSGLKRLLEDGAWNPLPLEFSKRELEAGFDKVKQQVGDDRAQLDTLASLEVSANKLTEKMMSVAEKSGTKKTDGLLQPRQREAKITNAYEQIAIRQEE